MHLVYDIAVVIQDEIIPYHLDYFLGLREEDDIEEGQYDETVTNEESDILERSLVTSKLYIFIFRIQKQPKKVKATLEIQVI